MVPTSYQASLRFRLWAKIPRNAMALPVHQFDLAIGVGISSARDVQLPFAQSVRAKVIVNLRCMLRNYGNN